MSAIVAGTRPDHFEPEALSPQEARQMRGRLEQIDYTAYAANAEIIRAALGGAELRKFEQLAIGTARARASWITAALAMTNQSEKLNAEQVKQLAALREAYEQLCAAYEGMRRMVERGYLQYEAPRGP